MKQSDKMSRIGSQKKKPINQAGRRTALKFMGVLLPFFIKSGLGNPKYPSCRSFLRLSVLLLPPARSIIIRILLKFLSPKRILLIKDLFLFSGKLIRIILHKIKNFFFIKRKLMLVI